MDRSRCEAGAKGGLQVTIDDDLRAFPGGYVSIDDDAKTSLVR
jgi:hypothetical protein